MVFSLKKIIYNLLIALIILIAYIIHNLIDLLDVLKHIDAFNDDDCKVVRGAKGLDDFAQYDEKFFIGTSAKWTKKWQIHQIDFGKIENGTIVVFDIQNEIISNHNIIDFPKNIAFHPLGIFLYRNAYLYIINHEYKFGWDRIEVVKILRNKESKLINYG